VLLSALIFHLGPARLRILYAIAFCIGLAATFFGFRRSRALPIKSDNAEQPRQDSNSEVPATVAQAESADSTPQVIRLSLSPVAARSTEMSQQQKVAAALVRAGIPNPASWTESPHLEDATSTAKSESSSTISDPAVVPATRYLKPSQQQNSATPGFLTKLLLISGALTALVSLYLFLRIR
jgi:hypothetical protein